MKAAIYSRKSKFTGKGESIENQIEMCKKYASDNEYDEIFIYEDEGFSGGNINRPEFKQMMKDAKSHKFDVIICYRLDRISRNVSDFSTLIDKLKLLNIGFISIKEQFDTTSPMGTAMMFISSVFAQLERETIAERIKDNMYELAKTGRWLGGTPPFGFISEQSLYSDANGKQKKMFQLAPVESECELIKYMYEKYLALGSLGKLKKHLSSKEIKTRNNATWDIKALQLILRNPVYVKSDEVVLSYLESKGAKVFGEVNGNGILSYNKKDSKDKYKDISEWILSVAKHNGLIDSSLWLLVQKKLDKNKSLAPRLVSNDSSGLLSRVLYCKKCGGKMIQKKGHASVKTKEPFRYYVCLNKINFKSCDSKNIRADILEKHVADKIIEETSDTGSLIKAIDDYKNKLQLDSSKSNNLNSIKKQIALKQSQINNLMENISKNPKLFDLFNSKIEELNSELKSLKFKKFEAESVKENTSNALKEIDASTQMLLNFKKLWLHADFSTKKLLIENIVDSVYYNANDKTADVKLICFKKKGAL
ncbi:MAG: recombinase family protein [Clostridium butyricum]|nr:recombinase family protein [Clostridium butyricum]